MKQLKLTARLHPVYRHNEWLQKTWLRMLRRRKWIDGISIRYLRWRHNSPVVRFSFAFNFSPPLHTTINQQVQESRSRSREKSSANSGLRVLTYQKLPINYAARSNLELESDRLSQKHGYRRRLTHVPAAVSQPSRKNKAMTSTARPQPAQYTQVARMITIINQMRPFVPNSTSTITTNTITKNAGTIAKPGFSVYLHTTTQDTERKLFSSSGREANPPNIRHNLPASAGHISNRTLSVGVGTNYGQKLKQRSSPHRVNDSGYPVARLPVTNNMQPDITVLASGKNMFPPLLVFPRPTGPTETKSNNEALSSQIHLIHKRAQEIPKTKQQSPQQDDDELKRHIVETVERTVIETVNRKFITQSQLSRHLTGQIRTRLCEDLVFERERSGQA